MRRLYFTGARGNRLDRTEQAGHVLPDVQGLDLSGPDSKGGRINTVSDKKNAAVCVRL
jgi:hypothetical protein